MTHIVRLGGAMLCVVALSACATITRGTRQNYVIETDPVGANVQLSTGQHCTSPCNLRLKRKTEFTVTATMDGYQPAEAHVESHIRAGGIAGAAGNVLFGGIIGGVVDGTNGSMNDLRPNPLHIAMTRVAEAPAAAEGAPAPAAAADAAPAAAAPAAEPAPAAPPAPAAAPTPTGTPQGE